MTSGGISEDVRRRIAADFQHRCAYCQSPLFLLPGSEIVEHIVPRAAQGSDDENNLCLSCSRCNLRKAARISVVDPVTRRRVPLFHPRHQPWASHFQWTADFHTIVGRTACGRATVAALRLNDEDFV